MKSRALLFIFGLLVWLVFTWPNNLQDLVVGVIVAAFVSYLTGDMFTENPAVYTKIKRIFWMIVFIAVFIYEYIKACLEMVARLLMPQIDLKPGIVKVRTNLKSETALVFLANAITLSMGTLTVDIASEQGCLYIHWMNAKTQDAEEASKKIVAKFEKILMRAYE